MCSSNIKSDDQQFADNSLACRTGVVFCVSQASWSKREANAECTLRARLALSPLSSPEKRKKITPVLQANNSHTNCVLAAIFALITHGPLACTKWFDNSFVGWQNPGDKILQTMFIKHEIIPCWMCSHSIVKFVC